MDERPDRSACLTHDAARHGSCALAPCLYNSTKILFSLFFPASKIQSIPPSVHQLLLLSDAVVRLSSTQGIPISPSGPTNVLCSIFPPFSFACHIFISVVEFHALSGRERERMQEEVRKKEMMVKSRNMREDAECTPYKIGLQAEKGLSHPLPPSRKGFSTK